MANGLVYSPIFLEHDTGGHPENSQRLANTTDHFTTTGLWDKFSMIAPREADTEELALAHAAGQIDFARQTAAAGGGYADPDTPISPRSYAAATLAVGGVMEAADQVMAGDVDNALCLVRPPGHHSTPSRSMGFCLFNNVALAALHLRHKHGLERILIIDFDVHHGNGTQDIFYADPGVMFISLHRSPFYPGTGATGETGSGKGRGYTINVPLGGHITATEYLEHLNTLLSGPARDYKPDFMLISAGFDGYVDDPIGSFCLREDDFSEITKRIREEAERSCQGRILSTLEGGYNLRDLPGLIGAHARALL